ncbi:hypothetical protein QAD02_020359 [Eretmocerus hayati]|uniref:Uncharacterized protein n=1 Tax=Eretmocerus hayati TaxID=131215 RepID=A0ACC2PQE3_9HYME|nr:hypothetical protein QAD02_020359 [Eretmocerus hayati]
MLNDILIGPVFIPILQNGDVYLDLLRDLPRLLRLAGVPEYFIDLIIPMQDGAPAHYRSMSELTSKFMMTTLRAFTMLRNYEERLVVVLGSIFPLFTGSKLKKPAYSYVFGCSIRFLKFSVPNNLNNRLKRLSTFD